MEIKCKVNHCYNFYDKPRITDGLRFNANVPLTVKKTADVFVKKPVVKENATGFSAIMSKLRSYAKNYTRNIKHTYDHKIIFALVEKELFGKNSIDSFTHDLDKMILYILGFPKKFVSDFHRKHSVHHPESGKRPNLKSMLCDNIASSPEFKPEKKLSLREHYKTCKGLQSVIGLKSFLEKYNYGEDLNFTKINAEKNRKYQGMRGLAMGILHVAAGIISSLLILPR